MEERPEVLVYYFDAGGGHRATAQALVAAAAAEPSFRVTAVSLTGVITELDWSRRLTGCSLEERYNGLVRRGLTAGLVPLLRGLQCTVRLAHRTLVRLIARDLASRRPRLVVSVVPNFNAPIRDAVHEVLPGVPFAVLMTDVFDFPPHFWLEPGLDRLITAHSRTVAEAGVLGVPTRNITLTSGMVLHPRFYPRPDGAARARIRAELGLDADRFVFLVLHGGKGSPEMHGIAGSVLAACPDAAAIAICGDNPPLLARMRALEARSGQRLHALGFTSRVAELMAASDLLLTKPGPGSLAEALHLGIPVVVTENAFTVPQERANARWVREQELGFVVPRWRAIAPVARDLVASRERLSVSRRKTSSTS